MRCAGLWMRVGALLLPLRRGVLQRRVCRPAAVGGQLDQVPYVPPAMPYLVQPKPDPVEQQRHPGQAFNDGALLGLGAPGQRQLVGARQQLDGSHLAKIERHEITRAGAAVLGGGGARRRCHAGAAAHGRDVAGARRGIVAVGSGLVLDQVLPGIVYTRDTMQVAHMVHAIATIGMMALLLGHIYLGTIGMRGAYRAMRTGYVNDGWASEHHALWHEDIKAGRIPAQRSGKATPAVAASAQART